MGKVKALGQILCEKGYITEAKLKQALTRQTKEYKLLGELLVSMGNITEKQLEEALTLQKTQMVTSDL